MKICEICKKTISEDEVFGFDGHESVCFECAEAEALKAKEEKREIQITHGEFAEAWEPLPMVRQPFPGKRTSGGARPRIPLRTLHFRHQFPGRGSMAEKLTGIFRKPPAHRAAFFA